MSFLSSFGKGAWTAAVQALGPSAPKFVAWGTGSGATPPATGLVTPASESRVAGTDGLVSSTTAQDTFRVVATLTANADKTITEVGTFQSSNGSDLCTYFDFAGIALKLGDSITFTLDTQLT